MMAINERYVCPACGKTAYLLDARSPLVERQMACENRHVSPVPLRSSGDAEAEELPIGPSPLRELISQLAAAYALPPPVLLPEPEADTPAYVQTLAPT